MMTANGTPAASGARRMLASTPAIGLILAGLVLPWNMQEPALHQSHLLAVVAEGADAASGLALALRFGRWWLWPLTVAAILACAVALVPFAPRRTNALLLGLGVAAIVAF